VWKDNLRLTFRERDFGVVTAAGAGSLAAHFVFMELNINVQPEHMIIIVCKVCLSSYQAVET
jgi:hypothetical protein